MAPLCMHAISSQVAFVLVHVRTLPCPNKHSLTDSPFRESDVPTTTTTTTVIRVIASWPSLPASFTSNAIK